MEINKDKEIFNVCDWIRYNKTFVHKNTGEVLNESEVERKVTEAIAIQSLEQIKYATNVGLAINLTNVTYKSQQYACKVIKKDCDFNKVYRVDWRNFMETCKLSDGALAFISKLQGNIVFPTNAVVIKGKYSTIAKLCEHTNYQKSKVYKILKELENEDIIKRQNIEGKNVIYFNPFLISCGIYVTEETYDMFQNTKYRSV